MTGTKKLGIVYSIFYSVMIVVNYWVGSEVGQVAEQNEALIQPAGYVFYTWGLIYLLLLIWIVRFFFTNHDVDRVYKRVHYWPAINFLLNSLWIIAFTQGWVLTSLIIIIALLATLIIIYKKISRVYIHWFDRAPFSIYFAWVTVATIVNTVTWVIDMGIEEVLSLNEYQWTLILLVVATCIAVYIAVKYSDWLYPLVFVWAYAGIVIQNDFYYFLLTFIGLVSIIIQFGASLYVGIKKMRHTT